MKRNTIVFFATVIIIICGCNSSDDYNKIIPSHVDKFAKDFINYVHDGDVDKCLSMVMPEMNNQKGIQFLNNTHRNIGGLSIDSLVIINGTKTTISGGGEKTTNYKVDYECNTGSKYLYFAFGVREQNNKLVVTGFNGTITEESLREVHAFTLKGKGFKHYIFLLFAVLIPLFIIFTLVVAIRTKIKRKWLWIIGILFGVIKFSLNWTTGQIGFQLISISIIGAGIVKSGSVAPWIISFSIPVVAIIFWVIRLNKKEEMEATDQINNVAETGEPKE